MRLSLRFILPLMIVLTAIAYSVVPLADSLTLKWFIRDIDIRTSLISNTMQENLVSYFKKPSKSKIESVFERAIQDERLYALGLCNSAGSLVYNTINFPGEIKCLEAKVDNESFGKVLKTKDGPLYLSFRPVEDDGKSYGVLVVVHDMGFIQNRTEETKKYIIYFFLLLGVVIAITTVTIAQMSWKGWVKGLQSVLRGEGLFRPITQDTTPELKPVIKDLRKLVRDLRKNQNERTHGQVHWSPKTLKQILNSELAGDEIMVVSNREPYIHVKKDNQTEIQFPASGVVTALEPIMRACSGTWIAHGSGSADKEVVDKFDHIAVPPNSPAYQLRRVWLSKEEEQGYYYGFANEGLWALCHIAHVRPIFRSRDWADYVAVNEKFAKVVVEEAKTDNPVILVQDYHFALLPKMIRRDLPKATIITFWHIPFPNSEVFGICPWREELIDGLLGSSILGFHTQFHCNNFLETIDRFIESRIDRETSSVVYKGETTVINAYPISIEPPDQWLAAQKSADECRTYIRDINHMPLDRRIGLGVDRLDYTKGILERFLAVGRLLELEPRWIGKFSFVQIASPSRSSISQYQYFESEVVALAEKINKKFGTEEYQPIILKIEHHNHSRIYEYYRGSDLCFVSSLHDGMNLVAKEFIASRDDEAGVLILSQFTGASKELPEALIVNPYDIDQCAAALHIALNMSPGEQRSRVRSMRALIQEFNVYRWAGKMLLDAARLRQQTIFFGYAYEKTFKRIQKSI